MFLQPSGLLGRSGGSNLRVVRLRGGSRIADRAGPEQCARSAQRLGGSGGMPPQEIFEF